jgi:RNA-binding protein
MTVAVPPTNPKKKSLMPSGELRRRLRGLAHRLSPVVQIGKEGVTPAVIRQVTGALHDHELIKVKLGGEGPDDRFAAAERLGEQPGVNVVQILGRVIVLYKRHPEKPRYEGAASKPAVATEESAPSNESAASKKEAPASKKEPTARKKERAASKNERSASKRGPAVSRGRGPRPAPAPRATSRKGAPRDRGRRRARP